MDERWLEIEGAGGDKRRVDLGAGLTRVGGRTADVVLFDGVAGELHLWDSPPKAVNIGGDASIQVNGQKFDEHSLTDGDTIAWGDSKLVFRVKAKPPVLEELPAESPSPAPVASAPASATPRVSKVDQRVRAGLLAELGLADKSVLGRWQQAVVRREFDVDSCAREILEASDVAAEDPRLLERSGRLTRDLVMAPLQRGTKNVGRKARGAAKSGVAFVVAQFIVVGIFSLVVLIGMVAVRANWPEFSFDEFLHRLIP